jgi:drug/metabolite transporter (DMT)-like permease
MKANEPVPKWISPFRIIPTKIHGILDYLVGVVLIAAPWIFGFSGVRSAATVPVILGAAAVIYSIFTDYELGLVKVFSMRLHLVLDLSSGIILATSPWIFGFEDQVLLPHLIIGCLEVIVSLITDASPYGGEWGWAQRRLQRGSGMRGHER